LITVLGSSGFIGSSLVRTAAARGIQLSTPRRGDSLRGRELGTVVYCVGLTADFRSRPLDAVQAHVALLEEVLRFCRLERLVYLSSTRVYGRTADLATEAQPIVVRPDDGDHLYNISKLLGESLTLSVAPQGCVARLSNVYGAEPDSPNFLAEIIRVAARTGALTLRTTADSQKDYVAVEDVVEALLALALGSQRGIFNLASGSNVSNQAIAGAIERALAATVEYAPDAERVIWPVMDITRLRTELGVQPRPLAPSLDRVVQLYARSAD
jgi:nucleoside-diphosphate-sugar epimerase